MSIDAIAKSQENIVAATLKLVVNTAGDAQVVTKNELSHSIKSLVPKRIHFGGEDGEGAHYKLMIAVACAHVLALSLLLTSKVALSVPDKLPVPMMVSLVSSPSPEPRVKAVEPVTPKPVAKKTQPEVKQKLLPTAEPVKELVAAEDKVEKQVVMEQSAVKTQVSEQVKAVEQVATDIVVPVSAEAEPVIEPPKFGAAYLNNPAPTYPPMARRLGEQGRVLLKVLVSESGNAEKVQIENSSGYSKLDQAAIEAVKQWTFVPAKRSNEAISAYVLVPIKFSLNS